MGADAIWRDGQGKGLGRSSRRRSLRDGLNDQGIGAHRKVMSVLLSMPNWHEYDFPGIQRHLGSHSGRWLKDELTTKFQIQAFGCECKYPCEPVLAQARQQIVNQTRKYRAGDFEPAAAPTIWNGRQHA